MLIKIYQDMIHCNLAESLKNKKVVIKPINSQRNMDTTAETTTVNREDTRTIAMVETEEVKITEEEVMVIEEVATVVGVVVVAVYVLQTKEANALGENHAVSLTMVVNLVGEVVVEVYVSQTKGANVLEENHAVSHTMMVNLVEVDTVEAEEAVETTTAVTTTDRVISETKEGTSRTPIATTSSTRCSMLISCSF